MDNWLAAQIIGHFLTWLAETVIGALNALWDLLAGTAFVNPDVTALPQVTALANTSLDVVNVCYVLAFLWAAIQVMGRDTIQSQTGPGELIPRLIIGLIAANAAMPLCSAVIGLANAFTAALTDQDITAPGSMEQLRTTTTSALNGQIGANAIGVLLLIIAVLIAVLAGTLLVQWIIRVGVLIVAVGIAPVALALHGTPQTEGAAKLWWRIMLGTLGTVICQAVALHTTLTIFLSPDSNFAVLGLPTRDDKAAAVMNLLIVVCLLWGVVKIPGLMRRYITQSRPSSAGAIFRVLVVQHVTRGLSRALGKGRLSAHRTGGAAIGRAGAAGVSRPWPVRSGRGALTAAPAGGPAAHAARAATPRPAGTRPGRAGTAHPPRRPVRPYTRDELAGGVDLYTRAMKARTRTNLRKDT